MFSARSSIVHDLAVYRPPKITVFPTSVRMTMRGTRANGAGVIIGPVGSGPLPCAHCDAQ
jgi:hypothetical protein